MPFDVGQGKPFYTYWENNADFANSGAQDAGFNLAQWLWMRDSGFPTAAQAPASPGVNAQPRFGANLAQYLPQAQAAGQPAQPMPYSGNLQMGGFMPGQMSGLPFQPTAYGWPFGQQNVQQGGQRPAQPPFMLPQPQLPAMRQMQPTNPFGAMGLQAYQQQLGGQVGGILQPHTPTAGNRYEQRYMDRARKDAQATLAKMQSGSPEQREQLAGMTPAQRAGLEALAAGQMPAAMQARMQQQAAGKLARDANLQAAQQALPWYLRDQLPAGLNERSPEVARARLQYYAQRPDQITDAMTGMAGTLGDMYKQLRGMPSSVTERAQGYANTKQRQYDLFQTKLNELRNPAGSGNFQQFKRSWQALPAGAQGEAARLSPEQAYAAWQTMLMEQPGTPWHALSNLQDDSPFLVGPQSAEQIAKQMTQSNLQSQLRRYARKR
jgi:hypothetical protein